MARNRTSRFKPRASIEWLDHGDRKKYRNSIKSLQDLTVIIERGQELSPLQEATLMSLSKSTARDTQLNTLWNMIDSAEMEYYGKLAAMSPYDLTAYHELMNPTQPPAKHHILLCDYLMKIESGELLTLIVALPPGAAKALALDTPIPTPRGWKEMGELKVGDQVFDENGKPCNVTWVSPIWKDRPCYAVSTDCGDTIIADQDHEWLAQLERSSGQFRIHETKTIARSRTKRALVTRAKSIELPRVALPIEPYLLGLWLGDGHSAGLRITASLEDQEFYRQEFSRLGIKTSGNGEKMTFGVLDQRAAFVRCGLIDDPSHGTHGYKYIPEIYMRAHAEDRLALLQGLIDSDGTICKKKGSATFCNTNRRLAEQCRELVRTLGVKAGWSESRAVVNGKDCGPCYRVSFYHEKAARLPRKAHLCRNQHRTPNTYIEAKPVGRRDTVCIEVDSPSHLFLCGRSMTPTHNSTYASRSFAQWVLGRNPDWEIFACGHTQRFAEDEFSKPNRRAIDSDLFRSAFSDVFLNPSEKGASMWRLDGWRGKYAVRGAESNTSGLRARLVLADDLFGSAADAMSAQKRETVWRWWTADVMNRRLPSAPIVLVNTLWHSEDVPGRIRKMYEEDPSSVPGPFKFLSIPAQAEEDDELGRAPGEWLWCKEQQEDGFYSIQDYLQKQASTPPALWSALFMNKPLDKLGDFIGEDEFSRYDHPPVNREGQKIEWTKTVISIDCAQKSSERSDYTAILVFRQHVDGSHYIVDAWRGKEVLDKVVRIVAKLARLWQANYVLIEDSGMGAQIIENYQGKLPSPILKYVPAGKGSKEFRFDAACPWIRSAKVLFPPNTVTWVHPLIGEMIAFPNGAHDDWVDAFSQYCDHELKFKVGGTKKLRTRI